MINLLASILVWLTGLYLIGFALIMLLSPARAKRFLGGFASSAFTHYLELGLRLIAGVAILLYAPQMLFSNFFVIFGWILVVTTVGSFRSSLAVASALCAVGCSLRNSELEAGRRCFVRFWRIRHSSNYSWRYGTLRAARLLIDTF